MDDISNKIFKELMKWKDPYQPIKGITHLSKSEHLNQFQRRFEIISDFLHGVKSKSILDVGCCLGFNCFEIVRRGGLAIGVELNKVVAHELEELQIDGEHCSVIDICECLSQSYGFSSINPYFFEGSILEYLKISNIKMFDCTLMLNVLNHMLYASADDGWRALNIIAKRSKYIILAMRPHDHDKKYRFNQKQIPKLIMNNSILNHCQIIGTPPKGPRIHLPLHVFTK